jgi:hypothetical protein
MQFQVRFAILKCVYTISIIDRCRDEAIQNLIKHVQALKRNFLFPIPIIKHFFVYEQTQAHTHTS